MTVASSQTVLNRPIELKQPRFHKAFHGPVFLVGHRYGHHASYSGYEGFHHYIGSLLRPPVKFRFLHFKSFPLLGWRIDETIGKLLGRRCYSLGLLLTEIGAVAHMLRHRNSIYHMLYGDTDAYLIGRARELTKNYVVATFHEPEESLQWLRIDRRLARSLDAVILVSESQRPYFQNLLPDERIFVVPHGINTEFFHPAGELTNEPVCLTVGGHLRDFETLSNAIDLVHEKNPRVRFLAVGTKHGHKGRPFDHPRVEFLHGISDLELRKLYQSARLAIFCFMHSTANNSILEAMACGAPVVATDVGGAREYLGEEAGILCRPQDPQAVADAVMRLISDDAFARGAGAAGRLRAEQFDYRLVAERQSRVYSQIVAMGRQ